MACYRVGKEDVFNARPLTDIMDDQRAFTVRGVTVDYEANVGEVAGNCPGDEVARLVGAGFLADRELLALASEEDL